MTKTHWSGISCYSFFDAFLPECVCGSILHCLMYASGWNSSIVLDFPKLFEAFKEKQFTLLWLGSHDAFRALEFHSRYESDPSTLTVLLDTDGNIFGSSTPVMWESSSYRRNKADPSQKSFLFTLKNPHNVQARTLAFQTEKKDKAIHCWFTLL
jgi:hypothetical protein